MTTTVSLRFFLTVETNTPPQDKMNMFTTSTITTLTRGGEDALDAAVSVALAVQLVDGGGATVLAAQHAATPAVRQRLGPQPLQQPPAGLLHVLLGHLGQRAVLRRRVVGRVHGRAGRRQRGERGARGERGQRLRRVVGALGGLGRRQRVRRERGAVPARALRRRQVAQVRLVRLGAVVALVQRDAVDVGEADGAERAAAGRQRAAAGRQRAAAAAGRDGQGAGRQAAGGGGRAGGGSEEMQQTGRKCSGWVGGPGAPLELGVEVGGDARGLLQLPQQSVPLLLQQDPVGGGQLHQ